MKDFQQLGSSFKNEKYSIKEKSVYTAEQNKMYKRACYGLKIYTQEELSTMHWSKKNRIKKVNARAQKEINLLKQERCIIKEPALRFGILLGARTMVRTSAQPQIAKNRQKTSLYSRKFSEVKPLLLKSGSLLLLVG